MLEQDSNTKKYKIEKGSVMETLIIPLYGKMKANELYPDLFVDKDPSSVFSKVEIDIEEPKPKIKLKIGAIMAGTRQFDLASECKDYLKTYEEASVVNLGCGLDTTFSLVSNGKARGYNIDFPDVIEVRNKIIGQRELEENIASDLLDYSWFEKINYDKNKGAVFFASGVFYYIKKEKVKELIQKMSIAFPNGRIVFDATNKSGLKKMLKTWLKPSQMGEVDLFFSLEDENEILEWSDKIKSVKKRGYMAGYRKLDKRYGFIANTIFKYADRKNLSQIIIIDFAGE